MRACHVADMALSPIDKLGQLFQPLATLRAGVFDLIVRAFMLGYRAGEAEALDRERHGVN